MTARTSTWINFWLWTRLRPVERMANDVWHTHNRSLMKRWIRYEFNGTTENSNLIINWIVVYASQLLTSLSSDGPSAAHLPSRARASVCVCAFRSFGLHMRITYCNSTWQNNKILRVHLPIHSLILIKFSLVFFSVSFSFSLSPTDNTGLI